MFDSASGYDDVMDTGQRLSPVTLLPLGVLVAAVLCDVGARVSGRAMLGVAAFYDMAIGLTVSFVALVIVLVDLITTSSGSGSRELVGAVGVAMTTMTVIFALVWSVRSDGRQTDSGWLLLAEFAAVAVGVVGAWFAQGVVIGRRVREPAQVRLPASLAWPGRAPVPGRYTGDHN